MNKHYPFLLLPLLFAACATAPQTPPDWAVRGVAAVYPTADYIAQEGRGATRDAAETNALAALSRYFSSEVSSATFAAESWTSGGGHAARLDASATVQSNVTLFAVRYAAPWYNGQEKTWVSAAYINREEAWNIFRPQVQKEAEAFRALFRAAESETDPLKMYFAYRSAQSRARGEDFLRVMAFGEALHPEPMRELVRDLRENVPRLDAKINEARSMAAVSIHCPGDFESLLTAALTRLLSGEGIIITTNNRGAAPAVCAVTVEEGYQYREGTGHFYYPAIRVELRGASGSLFSWSAAPDRQAAVTPDVAKRRAYAALAAALDSGFIEELRRHYLPGR